MKNKSYRKDGNWESKDGRNYSKKWEKYDGTRYEALVYENGHYVIDRLQDDPIFDEPAHVGVDEGFKASAKDAVFFIDLMIRFGRF